MNTRRASDPTPPTTIMSTRRAARHHCASAALDVAAGRVHDARRPLRLFEAGDVGSHPGAAGARRSGRQGRPAGPIQRRRRNEDRARNRARTDQEPQRLGRRPDSGGTTGQRADTRALAVGPHRRIAGAVDQDHAAQGGRVRQDRGLLPQGPSRRPGAVRSRWTVRSAGNSKSSSTTCGIKNIKA